MKLLEGQQLMAPNDEQKNWMSFDDLTFGCFGQVQSSRFLLSS
jgi:hypothetical protein